MMLVLAAVIAVTMLQFGGAEGHNNWAVIVSTSRYWHNYRHSANALSFYHLCKQNGIPDDRIVLFLADVVACSPRNVEPGTIYNNGSVASRVNLFGGNTHVDFSGYDVSSRSFLELMQGRYQPGTPRSRLLLSDSNSHLLVYLTGHGGDGFLKFQDHEYLYAEEFGTMFSMMWRQQLYKKALLVVETCHAESLCLNIVAPNVACVASSTVTEESFSHHRDPEIGVDVIDTFTYEVLSALNKKQCDGANSVYDRDLWSFFNRAGTSYRGAYWGPSNDRSALHRWKLRDFFCDGGRRTIKLNVNEVLF